jgi:hypothetical protein
MRTSVQTVTAIVFLAILLACGVAILYLGTSTGLTFGGARTVTGASTTKTPLYAQVGWLRNTSPWPVTITGITANATNATKPPEVYIEHNSDPSKVKTGSVPLWVKTAGPMPYQLVGGSLRYLGFGISPKAGQIAAFTSITVSFTGPLGFSFQKTFGGTHMAASSATIPSALIAKSPAKDVGSLDAYLLLLRSALSSGDTNQLATAMGGDTTVKQAAAFAKSQTGYATTDKVASSKIKDSPYHVKLSFYVTDPLKDGHPPFIVNWKGFRWSVAQG